MGSCIKVERVVCGKARSFLYKDMGKWWWIIYNSIYFSCQIHKHPMVPGTTAQREASLSDTKPQETLHQSSTKPHLTPKNHLICLTAHLVLWSITLLLKTSHNGDWMPASHPAVEGNNNTQAREENTGKGCWGQVRRACIEPGASCNNGVVTMLIYTQPPSNLCKNSRPPPCTQGHHLPLLMHPLHPSRLFPSIQIHLWGDFPMPPDLSTLPLSPLLFDLVHFLLVIFWC